MNKEKIIYGCYPSFFSTLIANILVIDKKIPLDTIMVSSRSLYINKVEIKGLRGILFLLKRFSLRFVSFQLITAVFVPLLYFLQCLVKGRKFYSLKRLCEIYNINYQESDNFDRDICKLKRVDVFLSMCLDQIIGRDFIERCKILCINIHPSDLPNFGGVEPIIMFLLSDESHMGVSIHRMTSQIDKGEVIARKYIKRSNKSYFALMIEFIICGIDLFTELYNEKWKYKKIEQIEQKYPYRSWPSKRELYNFENSYSYIRIIDIIKLHSTIYHNYKR